MTKTILWLSIIAVASVLIMGVSFVQPIAFADDDDDDDDDSDFLEIEEASVKVRNGKIIVHIETDGTIPKKGSAGAFGFGILTSGLENVFALTTHLCAADSPVQGNAPCPDGTVGLLELLTGGALLDVDNDGAKWHTHVLDLEGPGTFCSGKDADAQVNIGTSPGNRISPTPADGFKVKVRGDDIWAVAPLGDAMGKEGINPDGSGVQVVSFRLDLDANNAGIITDLCLLDVTPAGDDDDD